jgi:glycosyltransferase involved in cell wall biosynthesis
MIGAGALYDTCRQLIKSLHMERAVDLEGSMNHDQVCSFMQQSQLFAQHSLTPSSGDAEGTPVAIMEAGASGLPVVTTKHTGVIDTVIHGKTGFLVDEGDIEGMAEYIHLLLSRPELAAEMGKRAREHMCQNFSMESSVQNLRKILEKYSSINNS